ncbi:HNH endonuclease family protein [Mesorhizobium sp.]|uniref:HNH endonuclease family protein n=1 Tax=Mesorhizobium sp. TaxID=1871066 RepID=UPI000FE87FF6|nr:HNH endonuclease family protein [Mesorhizobium sp.]RWI99971.1 MAG: HNH endonuclease [Mesorhizobium sp.]RWM04968.1 MAG: HNH endonuclease [Mesorhizobium sp.]RWO82164.1 MAG: HNH endonuclease [Mesorhizobium sp.]
MWNQVSGAIESIGDDDDGRLLTFIRHYWVTGHGPTKERELATEIRKELKGETKTIQFLDQASQSVHDYVALFSRSHPKWTAYKNTTKEHLHTITEVLQVEQIRPLMFAVARHFSPAEADKAFKLFVSWSVRFLIFGGRGGMLDQQYSLRAQEVGTRQITKATELRENMRRYVPTDGEFEEAFASARVSRAHLARYYLRALDKTLKGDPNPEFLANEDEVTINLEHVMPVNRGEHWGKEADERFGTEKLLGNMVLVRASKNKDIGNKPFEEKREAYENSSYAITQQVAAYEKWSIDQIRERQRDMARLAVETWPLRRTQNGD